MFSLQLAALIPLHLSRLDKLDGVMFTIFRDAKAGLSAFSITRPAADEI